MTLVFFLSHGLSGIAGGSEWFGFPYSLPQNLFNLSPICPTSSRVEGFSSLVSRTGVSLSFSLSFSSGVLFDIYLLSQFPSLSTRSTPVLLEFNISLGSRLSTCSPRCLPYSSGSSVHVRHDHMFRTSRFVEFDIFRD